MHKTLRTALNSLIVLVRDIPRYEWYFIMGAKRYLRICNRNEKVTQGPSGHGYVCLWPYTSRLHAPRVWSYLGRKLLRIVVRDSEFQQREHRFETITDISVSVLIGHRGLERLPHLLTTLAFIAGQDGVTLECIVVEQDTESRIKDFLPSWVRYEFMRSDLDKQDYNRSAAFNFGAKKAKGRILLLHDNDMLIPKDYCKDITYLVGSGFDVINPKRFVFYIGKSESEMIMSAVKNISTCTPEYIVQNLEAGGSVAITSEGYRTIGGMDESFVGWGGEDNEFWRRCSALNRWIWGYCPVIHLWHTSQPLKEVVNNANITKAKDLINSDIKERIRYLSSVNDLTSSAVER